MLSVIEAGVRPHRRLGASATSEGARLDAKSAAEGAACHAPEWAGRPPRRWGRRPGAGPLRWSEFYVSPFQTTTSVSGCDLIYLTRKNIAV